jgi:hypothetical protein
MKFLFWSFVAVDVGALVLFGLLALAAAGPSRTNPIAALVVPFLVPAAILVGAIVLFVNAESALLRTVAVVIAAAPVLITVGTQLHVLAKLSDYRDESGELRQFRSQELRDLEAAVTRGDAAAVAAAASGVDLDTPGLSGATVLVLALRRLQQAPERIDVVRALIAAGADPNVAHAELPLQPAIAATRGCGIEPVQLLLDAGAHPNAIGESGDPAFFTAGGAGVDVAVMRLLVERGADVQLLGSNGRSAVVLAAQTRNWPVLELLVQLGAPWRDQFGRVGVPFLEHMESEERRDPQGEEDRAALARVMELLRAGAASQPR